MADTRTDGAHPQAATRGWSGAGGEQARLAAAHPSTGTGPKKHQAWRGTGSAMSVHAAPSQVRKTYAQRVFPPPPPPAETANTPPTPLRRKDAQVQVRRSATQSREGKKTEKCGHSARAAAKMYVTARDPWRFTPGHHEPPRAS